MKIQLLKTESEWTQTSLGCYMSLDGILLDIITPLNDPHEASSIETTKKGILKLVIRDMGRTDGYLGSVSIELSLLENKSLVILPLFDSPAEDQLYEIPGNPLMPRLTIKVSPSSPKGVQLTKNLKFSQDFQSITPKEQTLASAQPFDLAFQSATMISNDPGVGEILEIFQIEIESLKEEIFIEKQKNASLQLKYLELMNTLKLNCERAQQRESSLLELMNEKEAKYCKNIEINLELQARVRKLEFDSKIMQEKVQKFEAQETYVKELEDEIKKYRNILQDVEKNRDELTNTLVEQSLDESTSKTQQFISERFSLTERPDLNDSFIKKVIKKTIDKNIPDNQIVRIRDCLYRINNIEISLAICDDGIYVKCGNKLITLLEHWKKQQIFLIPDKARLHVKELENDKFRFLNRSVDCGTIKRSTGLKFDARSFASILSKRN